MCFCKYPENARGKHYMFPAQHPHLRESEIPVFLYFCGNLNSPTHISSLYLPLAAPPNDVLRPRLHLTDGLQIILGHPGARDGRSRPIRGVALGLVQGRAKAPPHCGEHSLQPSSKKSWAVGSKAKS